MFRPPVGGTLFSLNPVFVPLASIAEMGIVTNYPPSAVDAASAGQIWSFFR